MSWLATYLRFKENTVTNLPNINVAEINPNDDGMTEAEDNFSDCSEKSLFSSILTNQSFESPWQRHCKAKKRKEEVKQAPEKTSKELKIMEDISKSLQSTPTSDNLFGMLVAAEIKNLSPKKRKTKFEINNLLFKYQEDNDAAAAPQPPPIQTPPSIETCGNTNKNLSSISLNEPWPYDSLRKYMNLNTSNNQRYFSTFKSQLGFGNILYLFFGKR